MRILFFLLLPSSLFGQIEVSTSYCTNIKMAGVCISFEEEGRFKYNSWGCLASTQGQGNYSVNRDKLTLLFDTIKELEKPFTLIDSNIVNDTVSTIQITTHEESDMVLPFVNVTLKAKSSSDSTDKVYSKISDVNGKLKFEIDPLNSDLELSFSYIGRRVVTIPLMAGYNYKLKVKLATGSILSIDGKSVEYKILRHNKRKLILERENEGRKYVQYFEKVDEKKIQLGSF